MKANIFSLLLFILFTVLTEQTNTQNILPAKTINLNGSLSFSTESSNDGCDRGNVLSLNPQFGYFFIDNLSLSVNFDRISVGGVSSTNWGIGPSLRYYLPLDKAIPFLSLGYNYTRSSYSSLNNNITGNAFLISGGVDYFLAKNAAIETIITYSHTNLNLPSSFGLF